MAAQVPNIFVEQYDQGQKKIRADLMDENFAYVCGQLDANADTGSAAQAAADAAQATADGKVTAAQAGHAAMPSGQYIDLTPPASGGTVTAPEDGYITASVGGGTNASIWFDGPTISTRVIASGTRLALFLPVSRNDIVTVAYNTIQSWIYFRFVYANGSAPTN